jgi:stalled ribosome rescue protein Dom34
MSLTRAVIRIDHHTAQIIEFDASHTEVHKVKAHAHYTRQHGSSVRSEHEFFAEVCTALANIPQLLVTGSHQAQADFRHYVEKHRPGVVKQIAGWETVDAPSEGELVALAKKHFLKLDQLSGKAPLG